MIKISRELIDKDNIPYHKQFESLHDGMYVEVEVAYKKDIEAMTPSLAINGDVTEVIVYGDIYEKVVRCKDCRHQRFYINDNESFHCDKAGVVNMHMEDGDGEFFCKYGERKEL